MPEAERPTALADRARFKPRCSKALLAVMSTLVVIAILTGALATSALALTAAAVFAGRLQLPRSRRAAVATLILPVTGHGPDLARLMKALERQTLPPRRLLLAVESENDPAFGVATSLARSSALAIEVVVAGETHGCAQKCWNQIAALRRIDDRDDAVVLLDADILPQAWWLSAVVSPLIDDFCDIVSGYRWVTIAGPSLGAHLVAAIDRSIAVLPRLPFASMVWGGTLGFSRRALERLDLPATLASTLSDDCSTGKEACARGLRVLTRRALLMTSPLDGDLSRAWQFGRRQYQIVRIYRPRLFALALTGITVRLLAWAIILWAMAMHGSPWAVATALVLIVLALASYAVQQIIARRLGMSDPPGAALPQAALAVLKPAVDLFHLSLLLGALQWRRVHWGHVTYRIGGPRNVTVEERKPWRS